MKRLNLPLICDTLFCSVCAFLLFFTAVRFYTKNAVLGLIFGICAALLFGALVFIYISLKQDKRLLLSRDEKDKHLLSLHLSLSDDNYILNLFQNLLGANAKIVGKRVICGGQCCFFNFKMSPLTEDDIAKVIKYSTQNDKVIYCNSACIQAISLAENFAITLVQSDEVYAALKKNNLLPQKFVYGGAKKVNVFKKIKARFSRKLCAPLFWSGIGLLALSYFTFYPIYYIVSGGIMLLICTVALVFN